MANSANVIYLPPGVVPPSSPVQAQAVQSLGIPFDRRFFEAVLPQAIDEFCKQLDCDTPRLEVLTVDGQKHYVNAINGVSDAWVILQTASDAHEQPIQVFVPYQTIFRVEVHPEDDSRRHRLGFFLHHQKRIQAPAGVEPATPIDQAAAPAKRPAARRRSASASRKSEPRT